MTNLSDIIYTTVTVSDTVLAVVYVIVLSVIIRHRKAPEFDTSYFKIIISIGVSDLWMLVHKYYINIIPYYCFFEAAHKSLVGITVQSIALIPDWGWD